MKKRENVVNKNEEYIVDITDYGYEGEGIAKINGFTVFIPNAIKGEKIKIVIVKVLTSYAYGRVLEIIKESPNRVEVDCKLFGKCGGCQLRHIKYEETLSIKENMVQNLVNKTLSKKIKVNPIVGMGVPYDYRNKAQYPIGKDNEGKPQIGSYKQRTHEILSGNSCLIQNEVSEKIANRLHEYITKNNISVYDEETQKGLFRHLVIKVGFYTHEVMCIFVINGKEIPQEKQLVKYLLEEFPEIKTIVKNVNTKNTNVIMGEDNISIYGEGFIMDQLGEYTFKIAPKSFYQINPTQTEVLYNVAVDLAKLNKEDIVYDLYCGLGTIGIFLSKKVKKVFGIEIEAEAVKMAKENATLNEVENIEFYEGDVEKVFEKVLKKTGMYPDVIFVDPPRKGLDGNTIANIKAIEPKRIIYISCNPATLVRDIKLLEEKYEIKEIRPVDMFPFTSHVECVVVMSRVQK